MKKDYFHSTICVIKAALWNDCSWKKKTPQNHFDGTVTEWEWCLCLSSAVLQHITALPHTQHTLLVKLDHILWGKCFSDFPFGCCASAPGDFYLKPTWDLDRVCLLREIFFVCGCHVMLHDIWQIVTPARGLYLGQLYWKCQIAQNINFYIMLLKKTPDSLCTTTC